MCSQPLIPSSGALRALRRLACAGSAIGAIAGVCGIVALTSDVHRHVRIAQQSVDYKRCLHSKRPDSPRSQLARMFEAAESGEFLGIDSVRPRQTPDQSERLSTSSSSSRPKKDKIKAPRPSSTGKGLATIGMSSKDQSLVARKIMLATMEQHKIHTHNVYAGHQAKATSERAQSSTTQHTPLSAPDRIMKAMLKQLKSRTHTVFGRPSKEGNALASTHELIEPVGQSLCRIDEYHKSWDRICETSSPKKDSRQYAKYGEHHLGVLFPGPQKRYASSMAQSCTYRSS